MAAADPITEKQLRYIEDLATTRELTPALVARIGAPPPASLTRAAASALIDELVKCPCLPKKCTTPPSDDGRRVRVRGREDLGIFRYTHMARGEYGVALVGVEGPLKGTHHKVDSGANLEPVEPAPARAAVVASRVVPHGTYTVDMGDGSHVTLQLAPATFVRDRETTTVAYLSGPDNELAYTGFAFVERDGRVVVWRKFREGHGRQQAALELLLTGDVQEAHRRFLDLAESYALRSGSCMRCGKTLTVPASLHRGLGPVCAGREDSTAREIASTPRFEGEGAIVGDDEWESIEAWISHQPWDDELKARATRTHLMRVEKGLNPLTHDEWQQWAGATAATIEFGDATKNAVARELPF